MLTPCTKWAERLSAYLDHESKFDRLAVEAHLLICDDCRAVAELYSCDAQDTAAALAARGAGDDFADRVMHEIAQSDTAQHAAPDSYKFTPEPLETKKNRLDLHWVPTLLVTGGLAVLLIAIVFPVFGKSRAKARETQCLANQKQIAISALLAADENEESLPTADQLWEKFQNGSVVLVCPKAPELPNGYAYNDAIAGEKVDQFPRPEDVILSFDAANGIPAFRHNGKSIASFLDGHVARIQKDTWQSPQFGTNASTLAAPTKNYGLADKLQIAYNATIAVECEDVQGALEQTEALFQRKDGFVLSSSYQHRDDGDVDRAGINGRIPREQLGEMLIELGKLGTLRSRTVSGEDLTAGHLEQTDMLNALHGSQGKFTAIGSTAKNTTDAVSVEKNQMATRRDISTLRAKEYKLQSRVVLANITVEITGPVKPEVRDDSLGAAAKGSLRALLTFGHWLLKLALALLIWSPVWGGLLGIVLYGRKRLLFRK